ncbi:hypothetical protein M3M35_03595 [Fructilactobacillus myrtifloralis]|uniref:Uncharacterized protein n=1 Tax=Fructilactobacillus myrtifloralis TaxID=2940301 RepID=A0ABY5BTZ8_9LACO|nr:hypothetical protein [Fructilactobacillus myrtifloralis]USS85728.1 hypothetical protein M3M35_03595 [Fructilactobacillus myrtifloralis]
MENYQTEEIRQTLQTARRNHTLVNVLQNSSSIFYTGTVVATDQVGVIITTYTETGLANGLVYLTYQDIFDVDFESDDLLRMEMRIRSAQQLHLLGTTPSTINLNDRVDLLTQVLGNAYVYQQALLLIKQDGQMLEGFVKQLTTDHLVVTSFDKFDNRRVHEVELTKAEVRSVEFLGAELQLLSQSKTQLFAPHQATVEVTGALPIFASLHRAAETGQRLIMVPKVNPDLFFIGQVKAVNAEALIMSVVDMNGQFGGYELIRLGEIQRLQLKCDYLRLINHLVSLNLAHGTYRQPLLNDDRSFDRSVDLVYTTLRQAVYFRRFVRFKTQKGKTYLGIPYQLQGGKVTFRYLDRDDPTRTKRKTLELSKIDELAFGYLDAELTQRRIRGEH